MNSVDEKLWENINTLYHNTYQNLTFDLFNKANFKIIHEINDQIDQLQLLKENIEETFNNQQIQ